MEGRLREEKITKVILDWLEDKGWNIIVYDFPQSGTGKPLHLNDVLRTVKNKGTIIPDIVAIKGDRVVFFENKDRFVQSDFDKVNDLRQTNDYLESINKLLSGFKYKAIYYGVGLPYSDNIKTKSNQNIDKVDFVVFVDDSLDVFVFYEKEQLF